MRCTKMQLVDVIIEDECDGIFYPDCCDEHYMLWYENCYLPFMEGVE